VISTILLAALVSGAEPQAGAAQADQPAAAPAEKAARSSAEQAALVDGKILDDPERSLFQAKCLICHTGDYVTQQRLTEGQWQKSVEKMKRWGAPLTDDEVKVLAAWFGRTWNTDLPERRSPRRPAPAGSTPAK
jgi:cytochrome c5